MRWNWIDFWVSPPKVATRKTSRTLWVSCHDLSGSPLRIWCTFEDWPHYPQILLFSDKTHFPIPYFTESPHLEYYPWVHFWHSDLTCPLFTAVRLISLIPCFHFSTFWFSYQPHFHSPLHYIWSSWLNPRTLVYWDSRRSYYCWDLTHIS